MGLRIPGEIILTPWFGNLAQVIPRCPPKSQKPAKSTTALSADETAIYKAVLPKQCGDKDVNLNVAATTSPLDPEASTTGFDRPGVMSLVSTIEEISAIRGCRTSYFFAPISSLSLSKRFRTVNPP